MILYYFKIGFRNLLRNKLVATINILGLSIAIGCSIAVFLFLRNHWTMDNFHVQGERIYMLEYVAEQEHETQVWGDPAMSLGPALAADFPQVERAVRVSVQGVKVQQGDHFFDETAMFADTAFFDMFSFPLRSGDTRALTDPNAVVLSAGMAAKLFGSADPMGQQLSLGFSNQYKGTFTVKGIAEPFPENAGFIFDFLIGMNALPQVADTSLRDWSTHTAGTFVQLYKPQDAGVLAGRMDRYVQAHNAANPDWQIKSFVFDNLQHPNSGAYEVFQRLAEAPHPLVTAVFALIALLMMALSCFNYVNIALGTVSRRLKEIGVRKVIGGVKTQLITQFMVENLVLCIVALTLGLAITQLFLVPLFNTTMVMKISLSFTQNPDLWLFLLGLLAFTAFVSGAYPAFYIASFQPAAILKGKLQFGRKQGFSRLFLSFQFVLAFTTVIAGVAIAMAGRYWSTASWGYNPDRSLLVRVDGKQYNLLRDKVLQTPFKLSVAGAQQHVGESLERIRIQIDGKNQEVVRYGVGPGYGEVMGLGLKSGRFFGENRRAEDETSIVVNETFVKKQGWDQAVGRTLRIDGQIYNVAGVVEDFKLFGSGVRFPAIFQLAAESGYNYLAVRFEPGAGEKTLAYLKNAWTELYPDAPFEYFYQAEVFDSFYSSYGNLAKSFGYIAALALLIACMGLFGLASQNFAGRVKEASVRKVMGASAMQILLLVNRSFITMLLISGLISTAISYAAIQLVLRGIESFAGPVSLGAAPYIIANLLVFVTAAMAVGMQSYRLAVVQPSKWLKNE